MRIVDIKYKKTIMPDCSCGTGYSEPDIFEATMDNGDKYQLIVDTWYCPASMIYKCFTDGIKHLEGRLDVVIPVDNLEDAYSMYVDEALLHKLIPYKKDKLITNN